MPRVLVFTGASASERRRTVDALAAECWGASLLVVPSRKEARDRADSIILERELPGAWDETVVSFEDFARVLLKSEGIFPQLLDEAERRLLVEHALPALRTRDHFAPLGNAVESAGFVNHVLRIITKLKQAAVDPSAFRSAIDGRERRSWLDPIVVDVYDAYQRILQETGAYDRVGVYWRADLLLKETEPSLFRRVRTVLFDGFDDFTPSEFRLLESAAAHLEHLVLGVPCELERASARDLYAIPIATLRKITAAFPQAEMKEFPSPKPQTRTAHVAQNLFWRDKPVAPGVLEENLELLPCHDALHEAETIGRRVKRVLLDQNAAPESIAVVYRRIEPALSRLRTVFSEYQIPATAQHGTPLNECSFPGFLLAALGALQHWEREPVLDVLSASWFSAAEAVPVAQADAFGLLARYAGVLEGKPDWMESVQRLIDWLERGTGERLAHLLQRQPEAVESARALLRSLQRLENLADMLPEKASLHAHTDAVNGIISVCNPAALMEALQDAETRTREEKALPMLRFVLRTIAAWDARLPGGTDFSRADFVALLQRACAEARVLDALPGAGVRLLDAETARHQQYDYLFLAGMNEGAFPQPPPGNAVYTDEDIRDLASAGAAIEDRSRQIEREMLLLHQLLDNARIAATVSWSMVSPDGKALSPSPFIDDLRELREEPKLPLPHSTSFVPDIAYAASERDVRNATAPGGTTIEQALPDLFTFIHIGVEVEQERNSRAPFGMYDAVLSDPALIAEIARAYGEAHAFSVAQLEAYASCPFRFYLERILRVEEVETPEAEFDPRTRGRILHDVLQRFHERFRGIPPGALPNPDALDSMQQIVADVFERHARRETTAPRGVIGVERARMQAQLQRYVRILLASEDQWLPAHFEVAFGGSSGASTDRLCTPDTFGLETDAGVVRLAGRIDRIDLLNETARIVDYKTTVNSSAASRIEAGVDLQLPLYAVALEQFLLKGTRCEEALLVEPGATTEKEVLQRKKGKWEYREAAMRTGVARTVQGIRSGQFPPLPFDQTCHICANARVCRFDQRRAELKGGTGDAADA